MKHRLKQCLFILIIMGLLAVLLFVLQMEEPASLTAPPIPEMHSGTMAEWIQQRRELEKQLQNLEQEQKKAAQAPTSVFLLFATEEESTLTEAAAMLDALKLPALYGVSGRMLENWAEKGVPAFVRERLQGGWELCLMLEETPPKNMQDALQQLNLPAAMAAYDTPTHILNTTADDLYACGIRILIEDEVRKEFAQDDLWHIASIGNMHTDGIRVYEQYRNTGSALVNIIGSYRADQTYMKENLEGLLELIYQDSRLGPVQCLHLDSALYYHQQYTARIEAMLPQWTAEQDRLQKELKEVTQKITDASSLLNQ